MLLWYEYAVSKGAREWIYNNSHLYSSASIVYNICVPTILSCDCKLGTRRACTLSTRSKTIFLLISSLQLAFFTQKEDLSLYLLLFWCPNLIFWAQYFLFVLKHYQPPTQKKQLSFSLAFRRWVQTYILHCSRHWQCQIQSILLVILSGFPLLEQLLHYLRWFSKWIQNMDFGAPLVLVFTLHLFFFSSEWLSATWVVTSSWVGLRKD